ncbi:tRNA (adenosine(37)-N6)-dimethylallyltransferase MiaA [Verrucomicrobiaceae bacterium N1E253]|uniref:tRNA dimethylallyltransferase n=1 Tax=Oceaniferula marina TaxID=2748318 RepID=A0A851G9E8_9BACT|nr:tRNA (adenosine(37)-N6)-dimethylallyltransferase MiaA [Oceaniferula marina]NWK54233.1 tRNA (adenosine(37)-N6)-dimethylallyltransferase MiaA [Oceaniferula marina]
MTPPSPVYVCGPTASGKSSLAIQLAQKLDGEIVNADAYQLYRGIEILSAAPTEEEKSKVPHHLYGVLAANEVCDAMSFREMALPVIESIILKGKTPIVTGGSGMYLKFLTHGPSPVPSSAPGLRAELEGRSDSSLIEHLQKLDPEGAAVTNLQNRRYVIRALEICLLSGKKMSTIKSDWKKTSSETEKHLRGVYLLWDREQLRQRINQRATWMLNHGAIDEVRNLAGASTTCEKAIGIPQIKAMLSGELNREECEERIAAATRQYAKRQRTWFGKETWLNTRHVSETQPPQLDEFANQWLEG